VTLETQCGESVTAALRDGSARLRVVLHVHIRTQTCTFAAATRKLVNKMRLGGEFALSSQLETCLGRIFNTLLAGQNAEERFIRSAFENGE
jgi:hypothetical protein